MDQLGNVKAKTLRTQLLVGDAAITIGNNVGPSLLHTKTRASGLLVVR